MSTVSCDSMCVTLRRLTSAHIFFHHLPERDPPHVSHIRNERKSPTNCCLRNKSALCSSNSHFLCAPHSRRRREKRKLKQIRNSLILISLHLSLIEYWGHTLTHVLPCRYRLILLTAGSHMTEPPDSLDLFFVEELHQCIQRGTHSKADTTSFR